MVGDDLEVDYPLILTRIIERGELVVSRGFRCREIRGFRYTLTNVHRNVVWSPSRKLNHAFRWIEPLWMLLGESSLSRLLRYNRQMAKFSDDGTTLSGAYGPRLIPQLPYLLEQLRQAGSRQAVATIWMPNPRPSKDIPCTVMHHYLVRNDRLELIVYMRSNDAWLGFPYDVFTFTTIQKVLAGCLGIEPGYYMHLVGSFHLYETDVSKLDGYLTTTQGSELRFLWPTRPLSWNNCAKQVREIGVLEQKLTDKSTLVDIPIAWVTAFVEFQTHLRKRAHVV